MAQKRNYNITTISIPQDPQTTQTIKRFKHLLVEMDISTFSEGVLYAIEAYLEKHGVKTQDIPKTPALDKCEVKGCKNPSSSKLQNGTEVTVRLCDKHKVDYLESKKWKLIQ